MILDLHEAGLEGTLFADVCIIGSGAAGITAAREFIGTPYTVVALEGGGNKFEASSQEPYQSEVLGLAHGGIHQGRVRGLGGTTSLWAGQALPLFDIDFQEREWVAYSGWPLDKQVLLPYYARAEKALQLPAATYDVRTWPRRESPPAYDAAKIVPFYSQFTATPDFAQMYRRELHEAQNITVLTHANVVALQANEAATALEQVQVRSFQQHRLCIQAKYYIVCCGGIETARLLLASNAREPSGVGNKHDVVGRFFQDHPGVSVQALPHNRRQFALCFDGFRRESVKYALKMTASAYLQRSRRLLNVGAEVYYAQDENSPINASRRLLEAIRVPEKRKTLPGALVSVARQPHRIARAAYRYYVIKQPAGVGSGPPRLGFGVEQEPNPNSRITLSKDVDCLGMRRAALDWRMTGAETRAIQVFAQTVWEEWKRLGLADFDLAELQVAGREQGLHGGFVDAFHHMGTTRMGTNPKTSVVNADCRVHDYDNLYIGSSAVFPTSGFSNPTLTILALTLRIADELKMRLAKTSVLSTDSSPAI